MSLQAQLTKKGTEEAVAATVWQALTCAAGDGPFRCSWTGRMQALEVQLVGRMQGWLQLLPGT